MAVRLGSAYGEVKIDASGVREGIEGAQRSVSGFGDTIKGVFTFAAGNLVAQGFQALTSAMVGIKNSAIESASTLQDLGLALETLAAREIAMAEDIPLTEAMETAGEAAESLMGDLQELAIVSPFEFSTVSNVLKVQMAFGATSETAVDLTRAILNTGAAFGQSGEQLDRMNFNLAQALVMGDLTGGNLRQLKMVGLDLAGVLEGELGMSIQEVRDALEDSSLTMEEVSEAFVRYTDQNFGNAAERMSKTYSGLKSSMNDLFFFAGSDLVTPMMEVATEVLGEMFDEANAILRSGVLKKVGEQLGESLRQGVTWLKEEGIPVLVEWGETFRRVTLPRIREFVSNGLDWLQTKGRELWKWISKTAIPKLREWGNVFTKEVLPKVMKFIETLISFGRYIAFVVTKGDYLNDWIVHLPKSIRPFIRTLGQAIAVLREWGTTFIKALPSIKEFVRDGINSVVKNGKAAWAWITGTAIPTLQRWGTAFQETLAKVKEFVREVRDRLWLLNEVFKIGGLGTVIKLLIDDMKTAAKELVQGVDWEGIGQKIIARVERGLQAAYGAVRTWVEEIGVQLRESIRQIDWKETARLLLSRIGEGIGTAYEMVKQWAETMVGSLGQSLSQVDWSAVGQSVLDGINAAFASVKTWLDETGAGLGISLGLKVAGGLGLISGPAGLAAGALLLVTTHLDTIKEAVAGVVDAVREKMPTLMEAFGDVGNFWTENGPGISESINNVFEKAIEVIGEFAENYIPWYIDQLAKIAAWLDENGPLIDDFVRLISKAVVFMLGAVGRLYKILLPILTVVVDNVLGLAKVIMQLATGDWAGAWETMKATAKKNMDSVKKILVGVADYIVSFLGTDWETVVEAWRSSWEMLPIVVDEVFTKFFEEGIEGWRASWEMFPAVVEEVFIKPLEQAIEGVTGMVDGMITDIQNLAKGFEGLSGINLPDWLTPGSPTPFEIGLRGIASAIQGMPDLSVGMGLGAMPALAPAMAGAGAGGAGLGGGGGDGPMVNFYGPVTVEGVQDAPSFLEELTRMAEGR